MISTIIFDLDGLLADTERLHMQSYRKVMANHGMDLTERQYRDHWIRDGKGIAAYKKMHELDIDAVAFHEEKKALYRRLVAKSAQPMPGALEAIERLTHEFGIALASNSYRKNVELVLDVIGLTEKFDVVITGDEVTQAKPSPEIFLTTAKKLGVVPSACVVIEDSAKGILAADAAGMKSIAIPNEYTSDNDFSKASVVVASLRDVSSEMILEL